MCFQWTAYLLPLYCLSHFVFSNRPELLYSSTLTVFFRRGRFSGKQNILLHIVQSNFSQRTHSTPFALPDVPANWLENVKNLEFVVTKGKDDVFQCFIDKNEPTKSVSLWLALALQLHNSSGMLLFSAPLCFYIFIWFRNLSKLLETLQTMKKWKWWLFKQCVIYQNSQIPANYMTYLCQKIKSSHNEPLHLISLFPFLNW